MHTQTCFSLKTYCCFDVLVLVAVEVVVPRTP